MENDFFYTLFWKNTNVLYWGSKNILDILYVYEHHSFKKDLELRIVTEKNPCSIWKDW